MQVYIPSKCVDLLKAVQDGMWVDHYHYPLCTLALDDAQLYILLALE